jgi:SAM-dependent methyltransferase
LKFNTTDEQYLRERKALSEELGPRELWSVIDHWPLYCGLGNLSRFMAISDILRSTLSVPGHVAEFGSWRGATLLFLAKLLRIYDPHGSKVVHCFESFEGMAEYSPEDDKLLRFQGQYKGSLGELKDFIELYRMSDELEIHKGLIQETLPKVLEEDKALSFSFVYLDVDFYEPTRVILEQIHPRLVKGGVFVFDEWNYNSPEGIVANEFFHERSEHYEAVSVVNARQPSLVLRKIRM